MSGRHFMIKHRFHGGIGMVICIEMYPEAGGCIECESFLEFSQRNIALMVPTALLA